MKKPSAAKPPEQPVFFIDRSLGVEPVRSALQNGGQMVEVHDDHFARDAEDRIWLREVTRRGWVVLTKNQRIRYRPLEAAALRESHARVFILVAGNLKGTEIADVFVKALPAMQTLLRSRSGGFVARVTRSGQVNI